MNNLNEHGLHGVSTSHIHRLQGIMLPTGGEYCGHIHDDVTKRLVGLAAQIRFNYAQV